MLVYKIDVLQALKERGYNTNYIRINNLLSQGTLQKLRNKESIGWSNIETICDLLDCQPGDLLESTHEQRSFDDNLIPPETVEQTNIRNEIKSYIVKSGKSLTEVVAKMNENRPESKRTTPQNISSKLSRGTIKYSEVKEIAEIIGFEIVWEKRVSGETRRG